MIYYTFDTLTRWGVFDVILPFILVFTIVYAILKKTRILGNQARNFNVVISLVMGAAVIVPHVLYGDRSGAMSPYLANGFPDVVNIINRALPSVSVVLVAIIMLLLILGVWGHRITLANSSLSGLIALLSFLAVIWIFGAAAEWWYLPGWWWTQALLDPDTQALVVTILIFAIVIWFITKEEKTEDKKETTFLKSFGDLFDKNKD